MYERIYTDYNEGRLQSRDVDEFMGIARILAEKPALGEEDARFLAKWLEENRRVMDQPLIRPISDNIRSDLLSPSRRKAIHDLLRALSGDINGDGIPDGPAAIAYTDPPPKIIFFEKRFCFTGTFEFGQRWECELAVERRGGTYGEIAQCTDYLVIGSKVTDAWKHSTFGRKINKAAAWQLAGLSDVKIVSEKQWVKCVNAPDADNDRGKKPAAPRTPPSGGQAVAVKWKRVFGRRGRSP